MRIDGAVNVLNILKHEGLNWYECGESGVFWVEGVKGEPYQDEEIIHALDEQDAIELAERLLVPHPDYHKVECFFSRGCKNTTWVSKVRRGYAVDVNWRYASDYRSGGWYCDAHGEDWKRGREVKEPSADPLLF